MDYTAFDQLKRRLLKRQLSKKRGTKPSSEALSAFSAFVLGAILKCIATCLTYPAIRCKVTIQAKSDEDEIKEDQPKAQKTVSGAIHTIWKREGLLGFFKGLRAQILKTVLSSALLMMVKEKITKTTWVLMLALQRVLHLLEEEESLVCYELEDTMLDIQLMFLKGILMKWLIITVVEEMGATENQVHNHIIAVPLFKGNY
ncbi:unnamed protein product [Camellia sinensis]